MNFCSNSKSIFVVMSRDQTQNNAIHASERIETFILMISHSSISDTSLGLVWYKKGFSLHLNDLNDCTEHAQKI